MLICDHAIREEGSGKISLIGIFEQINAASVPVPHPALSVYAKVTDAQGEYDLSLDLVRLEDLMVIGHGEAHATVADRLVPTELLFNLAWLLFERAGEYEFRLSANGRYVASKSFRVILWDQPQVGQGGPPPHGKDRGRLEVCRPSLLDRSASTGRADDGGPDRAVVHLHAPHAPAAG
jgi:hypothetical protein